MSDQGTPSDYVPREVLERLVEDLTVEDVRIARTEFPEGDPMRGFGAVYHAAQRTGYVNGETMEQFLGRVRIRDLTPIMAAASDALPEGRSGGEISPLSAAIGE